MAATASQPGPWLRGDDGDVAAGRRGVGEPGRQQRRLHTPPAMGGRGRRAGELRDALRGAEAATDSHDPLPPRGIAHDTCRSEITLGARDHFPGEVLVAGHALIIGVGEAIHYHVDP
jgi:hypothetical protein